MNAPGQSMDYPREQAAAKIDLAHDHLKTETQQCGALQALLIANSVSQQCHCYEQTPEAKDPGAVCQNGSDSKTAPPVQFSFSPYPCIIN